MSKMSVSFTLGKASGLHGGNIEHNNRKFRADNVNVSRIKDNVTYVEQDIREAYHELFSESLEEYNAKQKRNDRKIENYYNHISEGNREEPFYEIVVQFGDSEIAPVGSELGEKAKIMLDEYMREFQKRNKNLHVFNAVLHADEASFHVHIDVIPFYTKNRKNGLQKGVSMKSALDEQGFTAKNFKMNRLVAWENNEREVMESILKRHGFNRDFKKAKHRHLTVDEFKQTKDSKKKVEHFYKKMYGNLPENELTRENLLALKSENSLLKTEKENLTRKLELQRFSPWKSFYYSSPDKQTFVQNKLIELQIPFRETDNGFEAQEYFVTEIRKIEKQFKPIINPHRDKLRDDIDKFILQSKNYDEMLQRLKNEGYELKQGKYLAFKPKFGKQFIRVKSLGEDYSEIALKNRFVHKQRFETDINTKISNAVKQNPDSVKVMGYKTVRQYTVIFAQNLLPMRKINKRKPFTWTNDAELDKLSELNKKLNMGLTIEKARSEFAVIENTVSEREKKIEELKSELVFFNDLHDKAVRCFTGEPPVANSQNTENILKELTEHRITADNYYKIKDELIDTNEKEIADIEESLTTDRANLRESAATLEMLERIAGGTYVQNLIDEEKERRKGKYMNGYRTVE